MSTSLLDVLPFPASLSTLSELSSLLSCQSCGGAPGQAPALLDECGHSVCRMCCDKEDEGKDEDDDEDSRPSSPEEGQQVGKEGFDCIVIERA